MYRMPEDALGSCPHSDPDIQIYQRIYKFVVDFRSQPNTLSK